ncbi:hypothetical protein OKW30_002175 [Paraburkholderia sp. Clong3]|uniref:DUF4148 domain-containing protein n=1 Tax=Paraburkholderia sp. Clong3 TaxID=2991061 RepID=UPI003D208F5B
MAKTFISALVLVPILALPTIASASSNGPLTREQVRAELVQLHQAGYDRNHGDAHYPTHLSKPRWRAWGTSSRRSVATVGRTRAPQPSVHPPSRARQAPPHPPSRAGIIQSTKEADRLSAEWPRGLNRPA